MGLSWGLLGPFWGHRGLYWGDLGPILGLPGATCPLLYFPPISVNIVKLVVWLMRNACFWNPPTLAVSKATVGAPLGPSWAILGYLKATLVPSWAILAPSWAHLGPSWGHLDRVSAKFAGAHFVYCKICLGKFCVTQNLLGQILRNAKFAVANFA